MKIEIKNRGAAEVFYGGSLYPVNTRARFVFYLYHVFENRGSEFVNEVHNAFENRGNARANQVYKQLFQVLLKAHEQLLFNSFISSPQASL